MPERRPLVIDRTTGVVSEMPAGDVLDDAVMPTPVVVDMLKVDGGGPATDYSALSPTVRIDFGKVA